MRRLRWLELAYAVLVLFWLPVEDVHSNWILLIAALGCGLGTLHLIFRGRRMRPLLFRHYLFVGVLSGGSVPIVAVLMMVFKSGLHSHVVPDFTFPQLLEVLARLPAWISGGALIGLGAGLYCRSVSGKMNPGGGDANRS